VSDEEVKVGVVLGVALGVVHWVMLVLGAPAWPEAAEALPAMVDTSVSDEEVKVGVASSAMLVLGAPAWALRLLRPLL